MSATIRTLKAVSQARQRKLTKSTHTLEEIWSDRTKRARLILLLVGLLLTLSSSFAKKNLARDSEPSVSELSSEVNTLSDDSIVIDKTLIDGRRQQDAARDKTPQRVIIPSVNIDLEVREARVIRGYWEVFPRVAGFGKGSAYPGEKGNIVIFAHARPGLFFDLPKVSTEDTIYILTPQGWFRYRIVAKREVLPLQKEVIQATNDEILTLYTCSGFADSKRLIVIAKPKK